MLSYHTCPLATLGGKDTGGMNVYVRDLTRELGRHAIGVDVFTRSQDEHVPHVLHDLGYGNRIVHVPAGPETPMAKTRLTEYLPAFVAWILDFVESKGLRYDLIHSHYWLSGLAALDLRREWGLPFVQMFHTLAEMKNRVARNVEEVASQLRLETELRLMRTADRVVASTQAELAQIQWLYRVDTRRVVVIPPGVDTSRFYPIPVDEAKEFIAAQPGDRIILFVGRVEPLKGIDLLFKAVAILKARDASLVENLCVMVIGGDNETLEKTKTDEMSRLRSLAQTLDIEDLVAFLGKRDQDTLQYFYSAADVVVMPSHYESFGMVALESMACGTPVVASETGGLVFLVKDGETGFHVPTDDAEALADKLQILMEDKELRARLGSQAVRYAQQYAWSRVVVKVIDLYNDLIGTAA